jgi:hypothetical protein
MGRGWDVGLHDGVVVVYMQYRIKSHIDQSMMIIEISGLLGTLYTTGKGGESVKGGQGDGTERHGDADVMIFVVVRCSLFVLYMSVDVRPYPIHFLE